MQLFLDRGTDRVAVHIYEHPNAKSFFLIVPAMGAPARFYRGFAEALRDAGNTVAVMDLRGTGESAPASGRGSSYGYGELADDVGSALDAVTDYRSGRNTVLLGHSLGGQIALLYLARAGHGVVDSLILVATGIPHWKAYGSRAWQANLLRTYVRCTVRAFGYWPGWGFGGRQSAGVMNDWAHTSRTGEYAPSLGADETIADINIPTLAVSIEGDTLTPPAVVDHLLGRLLAAPLDRAAITDELAGMPVDHFTWAKAAVPVARLVLSWEPAR